MPVRAVFFDFGGVLYKTPDRSWMKRWMVALRLGNDEIINAILSSPEDSPYMQAVLLGRIPESEMWARMGQRWHLGHLLVRWMQRNAMSRRRLDREVAAYLGGLRPRYRTAILSNAGSEARRFFTEVFEFHRLVDEMIISAEEGVAKPDERIYRVALGRLGAAPQEALLLDDVARNVEAARRLGMHVVHFRTTSQALADVEQILKGQANGNRGG